MWENDARAASVAPMPLLAAQKAQTTENVV
jgi:hypothetical protein